MFVSQFNKFIKPASYRLPKPNAISRGSCSTGETMKRSGLKRVGS
jgi:hypothetical protein